MTPGALEDRLAPGLADYQTEQFLLKEDLDRLARVLQVHAPEAVILYCARILEALAAAALRAIKLAPSPSVFSNLDALQQYNLIPTATRYWAHALRRSGNQVRHLHARVHPEDAELAALLTERWLEWFFRRFRYGPRLPDLTRDGGPLLLSTRTDLRPLVADLENLHHNLEAVLPPFDLTARNQLLRLPAMPAVFAEALLDRGERERACAVLEEALKEFPEDLRLRQLQGLYHSRTGNLEEARKCLEPLYEKDSDEETAGITAGVYKRLWWKDRDNKEWLEKSHRAYAYGWKVSKQTNTFVGINAAATLLFLGRPAESQRIAEVVRNLLRAAPPCWSNTRATCPSCSTTGIWLPWPSPSCCWANAPPPAASITRRSTRARRTRQWAATARAPAGRSRRFFARWASPSTRRPFWPARRGRRAAESLAPPSRRT